MIASLVAQADPGTGFANAERALEIVGLLAFAISGAMLAVRKDFELVGIAALALVTALGGGIIRDLVLGDLPPRAFEDPWYLIVPLGAAGIVFVANGIIDRSLRRSVLVFDAIGLGLFAVTGAVKASAYETTAIGAVLLAVVTATGGGIVRDVLANDHPQIFHPDSRLYAIPAAIGGTVIVIAERSDAYTGALGAAVAAAVCGVRLGALRWRWRAPRPRRTGISSREPGSSSADRDRTR